MKADHAVGALQESHLIVAKPIRRRDLQFSLVKAEPTVYVCLVCVCMYTVDRVQGWGLGSRRDLCLACRVQV